MTRKIKIAESQYYATAADEHGIFPVHLYKVKRWDDGSVETAVSEHPTAICGTFTEAIAVCKEWNDRITANG